MAKRRYVCAYDKKIYQFNTWKECEEFTADKICQYRKYETQEELEAFKEKYKNWAGKMYVAIADDEARSFNTWKECKAFVDEHKGCRYKGFVNIADAQKFINNNISKLFSFNIPDVYYCYLACYVDEEKQKYSSVYIVVKNDQEIKKEVKIRKTTDRSDLRFSIGEIMSAESGVKWALKQKISRIILVYTYQGIRMLANDSWTPRKKVMVNYRDFIKSVQEDINIDFIEHSDTNAARWMAEAQKEAKEAFLHEEEI